MFEPKRLLLVKVVIGIAVVVVVAALVVVVSDYLFDRSVAAEVDGMIAQKGTVQSSRFSYASLAGLPEPVQRYFKHVLKDGQEMITSARLKQSIDLKMSPEQGWMSLSAEEYYTVGNPGFNWEARLKAGPLTALHGRDGYFQGRGSMLIKVASAVTVVDEVGMEMDISALARLLSEFPELPTALLPSERLQWKPRDANSATAVITDNGNTVTMDFYFNEQGEIVKSVTADRYMSTDNGPVQAPWVNYYHDYREMVKGVLIPVAGEAEWQLPSGPFLYGKATVDEIQYNTTARY